MGESQSRAPHLATAAMVALLGGVIAAWLTGVDRLELYWIPAWDARLVLELDGFAVAYALVASLVGLVVTVYSGGYLPHYLAEEAIPRQREQAFYGWLVLFAAAMVGLAAAGDLISFFIFWDLAAIASYYLIGFDRRDPDARSAAMMALLVTGVTAILLLVGAVLLWHQYGSFGIEQIASEATGDSMTVTATALLVVAALAKSAQVPLHFWLARAMVAPTPVSAYLHSAAMVAAGVLLLGRFQPLVDLSGWIGTALVAIGLASMLAGGLLALQADRVKQVLAFSTFAQYGYVVVIYGVGGPYAAAAALFFVLAHAVEKSALFLSAGCVGQATGAHRISEAGGLMRPMPLLAAATGVAAAGVAGLPLTAGFLADEFFFHAVMESGWPLAVGVGMGAVLTLLYMARYWTGVFLGTCNAEIREIPRRMTFAVAALSGMVLGIGLAPVGAVALAESAAVAAVGTAESLEPSYNPKPSPEKAVTVSVYALGAALLLGAPAWLRRLPRLLARAGRAIGPEQAYEALLGGLTSAARSLHRWERQDLRSRIAAVLLPGGVLVGIGLVASRAPAGLEVGSVAERDILLAVALGATAVAALAAVWVREHLALVLSLAGVGYTLAVVYAFFGAPDVALVAVLVETLLTLMFLAVLGLLPPETLRREAKLSSSSPRWREGLVAGVAGLAAFLVSWSTLSGESGGPIGPRFIGGADVAHAEDSVTAILTDFRGLDTLIEVTVVVVAMMGLLRLLRSGRAW